MATGTGSINRQNSYALSGDITSNYPEATNNAYVTYVTYVPAITTSRRNVQPHVSTKWHR